MIYLAADHGGFNLKSRIKDQIAKMGLESEDCGDMDLNPEDDFVDFASAAARKIKQGDFGIFACRNGVGVDIVANRFPHLRSVLGFEEDQVRKARTDDNVNVLSLPADYLDEQKAGKLVEIFLTTPFSGEERFVRRLDKLANWSN